MDNTRERKAPAGDHVHTVITNMNNNNNGNADDDDSDNILLIKEDILRVQKKEQNVPSHHSSTISELATQTTAY
ncbi:unnamed protein product [Absidia cylindrospora]